MCFFRQTFTNGEQFQEDGKFKTVAGMDVIVTKGSYTIVEKDGSITVVNYTADEHGFHPEVGECAVWFISFLTKWHDWKWHFAFCSDIITTPNTSFSLNESCL